MTPNDSSLDNPLWAANHAPRCEHAKINGKRCFAPARRGQRFCRFHESRPDYRPPMFEDFTSLMFGLVQAVRALHDKAIDNKTCALTLYSLQIAASIMKDYREELDAVENDPDFNEYSEAVRLRQELERFAESDPKLAAWLEAAARSQPEKLPPHAELDSSTLETSAG